MGACGSELAGYWTVTGVDGAPETASDVPAAPETAPQDLPSGPDLPDVPVSPTAHWTVGSLGDAGTLADLVILSPTEAYAVGGRRVLRYDGLNWVSYGEPGKVDLYGVATAAGEVFAVGQGGAIFRRQVGALGWEAMSSPTTQDLHAAFARAATDVWAVGDDRTVLHFDGQAWTLEHAESGVNLRGLRLDPMGQGAEGFFAVGTAGKGLSFADGAFETEHISFQSTTLFDVAVAGDTTYVVGTGGTISVRKGTGGWKAQASNDPDKRDLFAVVAAGEDRVAFGAGGAVLRLAGESWSVEAIASTSVATANLVAARERDGWWAVLAATGGGLTVEGTKWVDMETRPEALVQDVAGTPGDVLWAAGRGGLLLHWDAAAGSAAWSVVPTGTQADLYGVAVAPDGTVWAVGGAGTILRRSPDGTLTLLDPPVPAQLYGVAVTAGEVVICGQGGILMRGSPELGTFQLTQSGSTANLYAAEYGGDGALWVAGSFGALLRAESGKTPVLTMSGVGYDLTSLAATGKGVVAVGHSGAILEATPAAVTLRYEAPGLYLYGVAARADGSGFAVGWNGVILAFDAEGVTQELSGTSAILRAVWLFDGDAVALGSHGVLLDREESP